ncbi:MAG: Holliday junction branch migration protein RuvA [Bacteroidia bacterium]
MIAYVEGKIAQIEATHAIIDVGGIGYQIRISVNTYSRIKDKERVKLHTFFQVREDAQTLYGFDEVKEKSLFEQLISISGVGGNTAMVILSSISATDLIISIRSGDVMALKQVKGIGAKTAGRIILELKDKIGAVGDGDERSSSASSSGNIGTNKAEAMAALLQLGLNKADAGKRIDKVLKANGTDISVEQIIKLALRNG